MVGQQILAGKPRATKSSRQRNDSTPNVSLPPSPEASVVGVWERDHKLTRRLRGRVDGDAVVAQHARRQHGEQLEEQVGLRREGEQRGQKKGRAVDMRSSGGGWRWQLPHDACRA